MMEKYMKIALDEAKKAYNIGEIPIGCVIVKNDKIISKTHNLKEKMHSSLCHAEILGIKKVSKKLKRWRLNDCEMYITMQPCPMCASAIKQARIKKVYYGVENSNNKISNMIFEISDNNENVEIVSGVLETDCKKIVQKFFENKRK